MDLLSFSVGAIFVFYASKCPIAGVRRCFSGCFGTQFCLFSSLLVSRLHCQPSRPNGLGNLALTQHIQRIQSRHAARSKSTGKYCEGISRKAAPTFVYNRAFHLAKTSTGASSITSFTPSAVRVAPVSALSKIRVGVPCLRDVIPTAVISFLAQVFVRRFKSERSSTFAKGISANTAGL
jgi:hypothetical protein